MPTCVTHYALVSVFVAHSCNGHAKDLPSELNTPRRMLNTEDERLFR